MHSMLGLAGTPQSEWKHFLYDNNQELEAVLKQLNPEAERAVTTNKVLFARHCEAHAIAHIRTIYHDLPDEDMPEAERRDAFFRCIGEGHDELFFKPVGGAHGSGAFSAERNGSLWTYCGESGTTDDLYKFCRKCQGARRGWLVQPVLRTHASLREISSDRALSTVRILTCMTPEGPALMFAVQKLARGLNAIDNFDMGQAGNMVAKIEIASGELGPAKGSLSKGFPCISSFAVDPDTGQRITGRLVPFWEETKELVLRAQATLPELKSLGWDVAITDQGPFVVEANFIYGTYVPQVAYGRGLKLVLLDRLQKLVETPPE